MMVQKCGDSPFAVLEHLASTAGHEADLAAAAAEAWQARPLRLSSIAKSLLERRQLRHAQLA